MKEKYYIYLLIASIIGITALNYFYLGLRKDSFVYSFLATTSLLVWAYISGRINKNERI